MNLADLQQATRILADDAAGAQLWDDADLTRYLNEAVVQACIRAKLLQEIGNPTYCEVALTEGDRQFVLHPTVWEVNAARRRGSRDNLDRTAIEEIRFPSDRGGNPEEYALFGPRTEFGGRKLMLDRVAVEDGFLDLDVYRLPSYPLVAPVDEPEIDDELHEALCHWALHKMYMHRDYDAEDTRRAGDHLALFEARFGVLPDANIQRKRRRHKAPVSRPSQYP